MRSFVTEVELGGAIQAFLLPTGFPWPPKATIKTRRVHAGFEVAARESAPITRDVCKELF